MPDLFPALAAIAAERERQIVELGFAETHDDEHWDREMAKAAACYCVHDTSIAMDRLIDRLWPWEEQWWRPKDRRRNLVRAAALIVAEIERLDRAAARAAK